MALWDGRIKAKEERLEQGTKSEDVAQRQDEDERTMVWKSLQTEEVTQHPTAKEELLQHGTALPDEWIKAKKEQLKQGMVLPDGRIKAKEEPLKQGSGSEDVAQRQDEDKKIRVWKSLQT